MFLELWVHLNVYFISLRAIFVSLVNFHSCIFLISQQIYDPLSLIFKEFFVILEMFALILWYMLQTLSPSFLVIFCLYHVSEYASFIESNLSFYFFASGFWVTVRKPVLIFRLKRNSPMFYSSTGMVFHFTFRSPIYLEIVLMSGVRYESNFVFSQMATPLSQYYSLKSLSLTQ